MQRVVHGNSTTATSASTATSAGKCTGNSATATKLATKRNLKLTKAVSGNADFDGSGNIEIAVELTKTKSTVSKTTNSTKINGTFRKQGNVVSAYISIAYPANGITTFVVSDFIPLGFRPTENVSVTQYAGTDGTDKLINVRTNYRG